MGNLIKLGEKVISKDKIVSAEIVQCSYPIIEETTSENSDGLIASIFKVLESFEEKKVLYYQIPMLIIEYESGQGSRKTYFYNSKELKEEYPKIIDTYNDNIATINNSRENPAILLNSSNRQS